MPPRSAADILHDLFCRFLHRPGFLSHLRSFKGYDEPEILPYSTRRNCLIGADAGHMPGLPRRWSRVLSSRATRLPEIEVSGTAARHSRVTSSTTFRMRKRRPQAN